jgi:ComF family protein
MHMQRRATHLHRPTWSEALLNLLFPPRCVACGQDGSWLCGTCVDEILFYEPPWFGLLDDPRPLQGMRSAAPFAGPLRKAIHSFKYEGLRRLAGTLGEMLYDCWEADPWDVDMIVPVALHPQRLRARGYNQSTLLARELGRHTGLPVYEDSLRRAIPTLPQVGLSAAQRAGNVRGAFACHDARLVGRSVLLVDDVITTGATLRAAAQALLEAHARAVWAITLARD